MRLIRVFLGSDLLRCNTSTRNGCNSADFVSTTVTVIIPTVQCSKTSLPALSFCIIFSAKFTEPGGKLSVYSLVLVLI